MVNVNQQEKAEKKTLLLSSLNACQVTQTNDTLLLTQKQVRYLMMHKVMGIRVKEMLMRVGHGRLGIKVKTKKKLDVNLIYKNGLRHTAILWII